MVGVGSANVGEMERHSIEVRRYGIRNWVVYEGGELLAVTVNKKGGILVARRLGAFFMAACV